MPKNKDMKKATGGAGGDKKKHKKEIKELDEQEIAALNSYNVGPYTEKLKQTEKDIKGIMSRINTIGGVKESDTGLAPRAQWDFKADAMAMKEHTLMVARCNKIIEPAEEEEGEEEDEEQEPRYIISVGGHAKLVTELDESVAPTDIKEGMRVGVDRNKYRIHLPLPEKINASVKMMQVEEKPDVTYADIGGCKEQIEKVREVVEFPLLQPERFVNLGIEPPDSKSAPENFPTFQKGVLFYGPPGTGKTLCARAVANRTDACFIRVIGSELVRKYLGEGAQMVRELFALAKTKKACILFFDEVDAIGGARGNSAKNSEVQRTMLELVNQLDGFESRGAIKVLMATNRPDTLDPALVRPGRIDRRIEFGMPDQKARSHILQIHAKSMSVERNIRYDLIARNSPNTTGAELRSVCTEAGMFALRARRKLITEQDFLKAVQKVVKGYAKFSSTPKYMTHN